MSKHTAYEIAKTAIKGIYHEHGAELQAEAHGTVDKMWNMVGCTGNCQGIDQHQYAEMYTAFRVQQLGCSPVPFSAAWENTRVMSAWNRKGCFEVENVPD